MRLSLLLGTFCLAANLAACSGGTVGVGNGDGGSPPDGGGPPGYDSGDPCQGLGCASEPPSVTFHVTDSVTRAPVPSPTFTENGAPLHPNCYAQMAGGPCTAWNVMYPQGGHHVIAVGAPGFVSQNETVDLMAPTGCCGMGTQLDIAVGLIPQTMADGGPQACSSNGQCTSFDQCYPGGVVTGCGICVAPNPPCTTDADCAGQPGTVCDTQMCTCGGQKSCVPACASAAGCAEGQSCLGGHCAATPCTSNASCATNFTCGPSAVCERRTCTSDADCGGAGFCVNGACYDQGGVCLPPPA